jgi:hypothetical protein
MSFSATATSFQQVHLGRSAAPSELQVIHSERVALERPRALCSTLEGVECQNSSGSKHRADTTSKLNAGSRLDTGTEAVDSTPATSFVGDKLRRSTSVGKFMQNPPPIMLGMRVLAEMLSHQDCTGRKHGSRAEISSRKSPGFQVESLGKLAAIFVSF